jgi:hypothetical protein
MPLDTNSRTRIKSVRPIRISKQLSESKVDGTTVEWEPRQMSLGSQTTPNSQHRRGRCQLDIREICKSQQIWTPTETQNESYKFQQIWIMVRESHHHRKTTHTRHQPNTDDARFKRQHISTSLPLHHFITSKLPRSPQHQPQPPNPPQNTTVEPDQQNSHPPWPPEHQHHITSPPLLWQNHHRSGAAISITTRQSSGEEETATKNVDQIWKIRDKLRPIWTGWCRGPPPLIAPPEVETSYLDYFNFIILFVGILSLYVCY